jgi:hypothetical protein
MALVKNCTWPTFSGFDVDAPQVGRQREVGDRAQHYADAGVVRGFLLQIRNAQSLGDGAAFARSGFRSAPRPHEAKEAFTAFFEKRKPDFSKFD